jgi:CRP-like cAMP-binding protein
MPKVTARNEQAFPVLTDIAIQRVRRYGMTQTFRAGDVLVTQGEALERFSVVLEGEVRIEQLTRVQP